MKTAPRTTLAVAAVLLALVALAGCGTSDGGPSSSSSPSASSSPSTSPSSSPSASSSAPAASARITIKDFAYDGPGTVAPGTKITVTNQDTEAHTVTADGSGGFDVKIAPGASATLTAPSTAGAYKFHCTYHSNMHGTLTVG